ncbi:GGDEF domain-containing protein [Actinoplanes sp. CA-142083]|uniref:GGDEF domain-containing protein n=1 Tax=Actinoplanes sp. CA-142083 TaxID=3239903 RepID=UPI003D9006A1
MDILSRAGRPAAADAEESEVARLRAQVARLESERAALWWAIHHDDLTGLANRRLLDAVGPSMLRNAARYAVLVLDLNGFKPVNDRYGHAVGDEVLRTVGRRLSGCLVGDLAVRLSGDEFAAILTESSLAGAHHDWPTLVGEISEAVAEPMDIDGNRLVVTASIGVTTGRGEPTGMTDLIRRADLAMYHAKTHCYYSYIAWDQN